jgi:hypothetical protein
MPPYKNLMEGKKVILLGKIGLNKVIQESFLNQQSG